MVKKTTPAPDGDDTLASAARLSAQQIWEAGLGAFAKAQEEGSRMFSKMVEKQAEPATPADDKLDELVEQRVRRVLAAMDLPTRQEVEALQRRVDELSVVVATVVPKKAAPKTPAKKAAPKKAPVGKAAAKHPPDTSGAAKRGPA